MEALKIVEVVSKRMAILDHEIVIKLVTMEARLTRQQRERHGCIESIAEAMEYECDTDRIKE